MDDSTADGDDNTGAPAEEPTIVDTWLGDLGDPPSGEDLEYDNDFLALAQAVAGKPATTFADAEPPDWRTARTLAESLFERTRDLRVAVNWGRSMLNLEGASSLPESLRLVHGLLDRHWDSLHPVPDEGDAYARINALADMCSPEGLVGDLRSALVIRNRSIGELTGRDVDIAVGRLDPRDDETALSRSNVQQMLRDAVDDEPALGLLAPKSLALMTQLDDLGRERFGYESAPDLKPLIEALEAIRSVMPANDDEAGASQDDIDATGDDANATSSAPRGAGRGLGDRIDSRDEALRAIDLVCEFLERTEPTNPAQMLLRRAQRLASKNFLELVRELAPDALAEVARIMGVAAESLGEGSSNE